MKRKDFIKNSVLVTAGLSLYPGCKDSNPIAPIEIISETPPFPYLEVSGTHYEVGEKIGEHFKGIIVEIYKRMDKTIQSLLGLANSEPDKYYNPFYNAALERFPEYIDELKGMADSSGIPFKTIFCYNMIIEITTKHSLDGGGQVPFDIPHFGCSDISYSSNNKTIMAHNEDFGQVVADLMYVVKASIPGKPTFVGLSYPGMILGICPWMNDAGLVATGNFITSLQVNDTIPWVFLARSVMEQKTVANAVNALKVPSAFAEHYQIGSFTENKITSVEFTANNSESKNLSEFYVHTNHLILPTMKDLPQNPDKTSQIRFDILSAFAIEYKNKINEVTPDKMVEWLSDHSGYPDYVCVHKGGTTISSSVFDFQKKTWRLYKGNPCLGYYKTIRL